MILLLTTTVLPNEDPVLKRKLAICIAVFYLGFGSFVPARIRRLSEVHQVSEYLLGEKEITNLMFDPILDAILPDLATAYPHTEGWWAEAHQGEERKGNKSKLLMGLRRKGKFRNSGFHAPHPEFGDGL